jgi:hypothetical protein
MEKERIVSEVHSVGEHPIAPKAAQSLHTRSGSKWRICSQ